MRNATAASPAAQADAPPKPPGAAAGRLANIGDIVWVGVAPTHSGGNPTPVPLPAIVTRVEQPTDPGTHVSAQPFGSSARWLGPNRYAYSAEPAVGCWTWPKPAPAPPPTW